MELKELLDRTGLDVLDHLETQVAVPVVDGPQAQGDLIVLPAALVRRPDRWWSTLLPLRASGVELVRGVAGNNPHTLVADPGACRWSPARDRLGLGVAYVENTGPAYLIHPEHGGTGIAPGRWVIRRQRESGHGFALVAD